jgi:hypothetical protein
MKSHYRTFSKSGVLKTLILAIFGLVSLSMSAATIDFGELELDKEYTVSADMNTYTGHFTAPKSGALTFTSGYVLFSVFTDAEFTDEVEVSVSRVNGYSCSFMAEKGQTYYFLLDNFLNPGTLKLSMTSELSLKNSTVDEGAQLSVAGRGAIEYVFDQSIAVDKVTLSSGSNSKELSADEETYRISGSTLIVEYSSILSDWMNQGLVKAGDAVKVSISGLRSYADASVKYNGTGEAEFSYVAAGQAASLVSATTADGTYTLTNTQYAPCKFLSYFLESNPNGKYIFTFSDAIDPEKGEFQIQYGSQEADDWYTEPVTPVFSNDNKTITIDVTGKTRDYKKMSSNGVNYGEIYLSLGHLMSADGQYVYTGVSGSEGSFTFPFYYEVVNCNATAEFDPTDKLGDQIEIYVMDYDQINYDGVKFSWTKNRVENSVVVPKSELSIVPEEIGDGVSIYVTVPAEVKNMSNVTVTLNNLEFSDGADHSSTFTNIYNVSSTTVAEDINYTYTPNTTDAVESCDQLVITFSDYSKVKFGAGQALMSGRSNTSYVLLDAAKEGENGNQMIQPIKNAESNDHYTVTFPEGYFELDDNVVSPEFSVTFIVYKEEKAKEQSITTTPANGSTVESCDEIVITFNDYSAVAPTWEYKATISKDGGEAVELGDPAWGNADNELKQPLGGKATEAGVYTVVFPARYFTMGEDGSDFSDEITVTFTVGSAAVTKVISDPEDGSTVESCNEITLTFPDYYAAGAALDAAKATISRRGDMEFGEKELSSPEFGVGPNEMKQGLSGYAEEEGMYIVSFPAGYFEFYDEEDNVVATSTAIYTTFVVEKAKEVTETKVVSDPESGSTVESCNEIVLTFPDYEGAGLGSGKATISRRGDMEFGEKELGDAAWGDAGNQMVQSLGGYAEEEGMYIVSFPAGYFQLSATEDADPENSTAFVITFVVEKAKEVTETKVVSDPESGSTVESCDKLTLTFPDYEEAGLGAGKATISRRGDMEFGEKELGDAAYGVEFNEIVQSLGGYAEEEGMYIVSFPAGYFLLIHLDEIGEEVGDPDESTAFVITFVVEKAKEVTETKVVSDPESGSTVESCDKLVLTFPDYEGAGLGSGKATISRRGDMEFGEKELGDAAWGDADNQIVQSLGGYAEEEGMYIVSFPAGYFLLSHLDENGEEVGEPENSTAFVITFVVEKPKAPAAFTSTPADNSTVVACDQINIIFTEYDEAGCSWLGIATISKDGEAAIELGSPEYGTAWNEVIQPLGGKAAADGKYVVSFPEGYFTSDEAHGYSNIPAFTITFTVDSADGVQDIQINNGDVQYFNLNGIQVTNPSHGVFIIKRGNQVTKEALK